MKLLLIRHAPAVPHGTQGIAEEDRPLTPEGRERFREAARGLARIMEPPDALLSSPLVRARETARIAAKAWNGPEPVEERSLAGGEIGEVFRALSRYPKDATIALTGHEPQMSGLLAQLIGSRSPERLAFRKGGVALVEVSASPGEGGVLLWYLPPRILRRLGRG